MESGIINFDATFLLLYEIFYVTSHIIMQLTKNINKS